MYLVEKVWADLLFLFREQSNQIKYKHSSSWFCDDLIEYYINHRKEGEEIGLQKLLSTLNARKKASDGRWIVVPKIINDKGVHNSQVTATTQTFVKQTNNHRYIITFVKHSINKYMLMQSYSLKINKCIYIIIINICSHDSSK